MNYLKRLYEELEKQCRSHAEEIYNYAIPQSWNLYGYRPAKSIRSRELLVHPYEFYLFTLRNILKDADGNWKQPQLTKEKPSDKRDWLKHASVYSLMVRTATAWDHDRDDRLVSDNLYHLNDNGTFLKSILLLPLLKRMGVNTLLLHQIFPLCKTQNAHDYPVKEAVTDFRSIDPLLQDKLVKKLDAKEQCAAFLEACHLLGFRVILEYCPGKLARENSYYKEHPEWFFWFDSNQQNAYHPPRCNALPQNTLPFTYALKDFYRSEDVQQHIALFQEAPDGLHEFESLREIELDLHTTIAPSMVDQINAAIPAEQDTTIWRMYEDIHAQVPRDIRAQAKPYLMQDIIRYDLHPARKPMTALWDYLCENICWYQQELGIDGIFLEKPYLLPEKLQRAMAKAARKQRKSFVMIAEDTVSDNSPLWLSKGYDAISGSGAQRILIAHLKSSLQEKHIIYQTLSIRSKPKPERRRHRNLQMSITRHQNILVTLTLTNQNMKQLLYSLCYFSDLSTSEKFQIKQHLIITRTPAMNLLTDIPQTTRKNQFHLRAHVFNSFFYYKLASLRRSIYIFQFGQQLS